MRKLTTLEKRLVVANNLGIIITHADGHRWIESHKIGCFDFDAKLKADGISLNNKIYGSLEDALDIIDECLKMMCLLTLEDNFWGDESDILGSDGLDKSRIDIVKYGEGGLYSLEKK